ncbi:ABC transporter ATP-binding protein [Aquihabitans sp. McL0605]|uniref:ABC transporter ATP-binding protein n=1 Tax=Aquihabitans sp. McL0605 TaxID=3415671 RepID=UPI003CE9E536
MTVPTQDPPAPAPDESAAPAVELAGIVKRFPGVVANRDVNLRVTAGTIHAIVGENGAGKSTLMKILYGMQAPDEGTISRNGEVVHFRNPNDAIDAGIGMVHQHFMLADNLTVIENIVLGYEPRRSFPLNFLVDHGAARTQIRELGQRYGISVDPDALVETLGVGQRQRVEILKVLYRGATTLILDEPTAVLVPQEVDELFANLRELKREGITILFISHKLDEVLAAADDITVIRAGTTVATRKPADVTAKQLAELMVGSELPTPETRESTVTDQVELEVRGLTIERPNGRPILDDVSFAIRRGEIVGVAGIEGNGQTELIAAILGMDATTSGAVVLGDTDITTWSTRERRDAGIGYVPEDRHRHALLLDAPLWENEILGHQTRAPNVKGPWIDREGARRRTTEIVERFDVRTPNIEVSAEALSGGNQQKLIIGRELMAEPVVMIAAHPTRGVDVGAQASIWDQLKDARKAGLAMLLVSADLEELIGLSDTLLVIFEGRIVATLDPATATPTALGEYMTGSATGGAG